MCVFNPVAMRESLVVSDWQRRLGGARQALAADDSEESGTHGPGQGGELVCRAALSRFSYLKKEITGKNSY